VTHFVFFDEVDEGGSLDFYWLRVSVVERQDEVEEVRLAEVAWRLFLEVRATDAQTGRNASNNKIFKYVSK